MAHSADEGVEFLRLVNDADSHNRALMLDDLRFGNGDQWPSYAQQARGQERPQLTINETDSYIRQVCNQQRQQRPRIKIDPVDDQADVKTAKVATGVMRHIQVNSDADTAFDTGFEFSARMGLGYWRLNRRYIREDSFDQDIYIDMVENPFTVYFDPNSNLPDGSDAEKVLITDLMRKESFKLEYPGAQFDGFIGAGTGDSMSDWVTQNDIRVAEYYRIEKIKTKLLMLTDGSVLYEDAITDQARMLMLANNIGVSGERPTMKRNVKWCKQTYSEILEEVDIPGRWIPVVPCYGNSIVIDGKRIRSGLIRQAKDPQMMINFWQTSITESIALAPKPKWTMAEGQDEGHENEWKNANLSSASVLRYKQTDVDGREAPPPQRIQPEPPPSGAIEASMMATTNLQRVLGMFDPAMRTGNQVKSEKTINAEQFQSDQSNYQFYDNFTRSLKHTGRIALGWFPVVYDVKRVQRIIGEDGRSEVVTLNDKQEMDGIMKVLNDMTTGTYDVVMETGPGYDSRRREGVDATMQLMTTAVGEKVAAVADDLIVRQMDFPGADAIADRLAAANPLSEIDDKSEIPPQAQMKMKGMQQMIQQLQGQLQQAGIEIKFGLQKEQMKQEGETAREHMKSVTKVHTNEQDNDAWMRDVHTKALSAQNTEEIKGVVQLLLKHLDTAALKESAAQQDKEIAAT